MQQIPKYFARIGKSQIVISEIFCVLNLVHNRVKSVGIRSFSGPYSVRMWENADQNNSE